MIEKAVKIFYTAASVGSFTGAARVLGMTQPNVTQQLAGLERELRVRLFRRDGRSARLTGAGEALQAECRRLFALERAIVKKVRGAAEGKKVFLLGGTETAGAWLLPGMAAVYRKKHPEITLDLRIGCGEFIRGALEAGEVEIALSDGDYDREYFFHEHYCRDRLAPVAAPGYVPAEFSLAEYLARGGKMILESPEAADRAVFSAFLRARGIAEPERVNVIEVNSIEAAKQLAQAGFGVAVISTLAAENEVNSGILAQSRFTEGEIVRDVDFLFLPDGDQRFIGDFIAFCREHKGVSLR